MQQNNREKIYFDDISIKARSVNERFVEGWSRINAMPDPLTRVGSR